MLKFQTVEEKVSNQNANRLTQRQQRLLLRAVVGSLVISSALSAPATAQPTFGLLTQPTQVQQDWPEKRTERVSDVLRRGLREIREQVASDSPELARLNLAFTRRGQTNEIVNSGDARWNAPVESFINALSIGGAFEGHPLFTLSLKTEDPNFNAVLIAAFESEAQAERAVQSTGNLLALARLAARGDGLAAVLSGMSASAGGKQLVVKLGMTSEQAGNLLRQSLAKP